MKNLLKSVSIILLVVIISTAFVGCRRKNNDDTSSGLMSDVNSAVSNVVSDVQSGMDSVLMPDNSSNGTPTSTMQNATSSNK